jgi:tetratricopeptide (TPR) repeat protein
LYEATAPAKITSLLENRIQDNPYEAWMWMKLGDLYHAIGARDASNNAYDKVIEITKVKIGMGIVTWRWTAWIFLSRALKARGEVEEATHAVERAIQIHETEIEIDPRNDMVGQISDLIHPQTICARCRLPIRGYHFVCRDDCPWSMLCGNCVRHPSHDSNHETISFPSRKWASNRFPNELALADGN